MMSNITLNDLFEQEADLTARIGERESSTRFVGDNDVQTKGRIETLTGELAGVRAQIEEQADPGFDVDAARAEFLDGRTTAPRRNPFRAPV